MRIKFHSVASLALITILVFNSGAFAQAIPNTTTTDAAGNVTTTGKATAPGMSASISVTQTPSEQAAFLKAQTAMLNAVAACQPSTIPMAHPLVQGFIVNMKVYGMVDGKCKFTENMPNNGMLTCFFSDQQRNEIRKDMNNITTFQNFMVDKNTCKITGY